MPYRFRATFSEIYWESNEPDTEPITTDGYTDPWNPWGGFNVEPDDDNVPPYPRTTKQWDAYLEAEGVKTVEFDSLEDAAQFVVDFPGGVWDYREGEPEQNYRTGVYREVTLHLVDDKDNAIVFDLADVLQAKQDARNAR